MGKCHNKNRVLVKSFFGKSLFNVLKKNFKYLVKSFKETFWFTVIVKVVLKKLFGSL